MVNQLPVAAKQSDPSIPTKVEVKSNIDSKTANLVNGFVRLQYYESILQDSIKATYIFADAGNSVGGKSVIEGLPMIGTEDVRLEFEDNNNNKLKVDLNVNKVTPFYEDSGRSLVSLNLVSEEFIRNEEASARVKKRYDGSIDDHIKSILKEQLKAKEGKKLNSKNIELTKNNYNFFGNGRKPYYMINLLAKNSVPEGKSSESAGFFFFETSEGFHFKSIDKLFAQDKKKSFVYTESTDAGGISPGYDGKILEQSSDIGVDAQQKFMMGAYSTKLVIFNPYDCFYDTIEITAKDSSLKLAGKELPKMNKKFETDYTRTTYMVVDTGTLPTGKYKDGSTGEEDEQVQGNEKPNFEASVTLNQSIRRYNQMFTGMMEITIAGDFSLHAGDVIFVDVPSIKSQTDDTVNRQSGGLYIIADLCHLVTSDGTWTKLNLARDSFGRKGNHSKNR